MKKIKTSSTRNAQLKSYIYFDRKYETSQLISCCTWVNFTGQSEHEELLRKVR